MYRVGHHQQRRYPADKMLPKDPFDMNGPYGKSILRDHPIKPERKKDLKRDHKKRSRSFLNKKAKNEAKEIDA